MKTAKNQTWVYNHDINLEACGEGIARKILAYCEELMCVENHFETGAAGVILDIFTPMRKDFVEQEGK